MIIAHLNITSWEGISIGAEHYYGKLTWPESDWSGYELQHILTSREAAYLNKKVGAMGMSVAYKAGEEHPGFGSEAAVRKAALEKYKEQCPDADFLIVGDPAHAEPHLVIAGDEQIMVAANKLYKEFEAMNGFAEPENYGKASALSKRWSDCFEEPQP